MAEPVRIENLDDPRMSDYRNVRDADLRGGGGRAPHGAADNKRFMAESAPVVRRLIESGRFAVRSLLLSPRRLEELKPVLNRLGADVPVYLAEEPLMRAIAGYRHHGGALAAGLRPSPQEMTLDRTLSRLRDADRFTLVLCEGVTNVDNVGAILRNAAAFGADAVVLDPGCADPLFRLAIRVSMGHVFGIPWAVSERWSGDLARLRADWGARLVAVETTPHAAPAWRLPRHPRLALVFGSEGNGLSPATLACCDDMCAIPMAPGVDSINVAASSAVVLYELTGPTR